MIISISAILFNMDELDLKISVGRKRLIRLAALGKDVVTIDDVAHELEISHMQSAKMLSRWASQGWVRRVAPGAYFLVELQLQECRIAVCDPWILVPVKFSPAYIGGFTGSEYWDLTDQMFREIRVYTARRFTSEENYQPGAYFSLAHMREDKMFGTEIIWREQTRVAISDMHRTILDMLSEPYINGGIWHVADCFKEYLKKSDKDIDKLIQYAERIGNGALFKRLGYLAECTQAGNELINACKSRLTKGHTKLTTVDDCSRLITRWNLRVPEWFHKHITP